MKSIVNYFLLFLLIPTASYSQSKRNPLNGKIYLPNGEFIQVSYSGRDRIPLDNESKVYVDFFQSLTLCKVGRKQLIHLLKTNSEVTVEISDKICIMYKDSNYSIVAGLTGVAEHQSDSLIMEYYQPSKRSDTNFVYKQNTLSIYSGCLSYIQNSSMNLDTSNVILFNWHTNKVIYNFSMDTIKIKPFMYPELLYKNRIELYCFAGIHEIEHLKPENIILQISRQNDEYDAMKVESIAFHRRKKINRKGNASNTK